MVATSAQDRKIIRDLANRYRDLAADERNVERRELWRANNDLKRPRPPVLCSWFAGSKVDGYLLDDEMTCTDPEIRGSERWLRNMLFHGEIEDDHVFEPWITVRAAVEKMPRLGGELWGFPWEVTRAKDSLAWIVGHPLRDSEDLPKLTATQHAIDEARTRQKVEKIQDAVGDVLEVNVDRSSCYGPFDGYDLSTALGYLHGIQEFMLDIYENPRLIHEIMSFMRDAVLENFAQCEKAGDFSKTNHWTWGHTYNSDLPDPKANAFGTKTKQLWKLFHAQEFTLVSPEHHREFLLEYQLPIIEKLGLIAYGCCENLENKIGILRRIPNLRVIAANHWADTQKCADQINGDYVLSLRPDPATVCVGFDPDGVRKSLRDELDKCRECSVEIVLKDVSTVQGDPTRLIRWARIARETAEEFHAAR